MKMTKAETKKCLLCGQEYYHLYRIHLAFEMDKVEDIKKQHPNWIDSEGRCFPCVNYFRSKFDLPTLSRALFGNTLPLPRNSLPQTSLFQFWRLPFETREESRRIPRLQAYGSE